MWGGGGGEQRFNEDILKLIENVVRERHRKCCWSLYTTRGKKWNNNIRCNFRINPAACCIAKLVLITPHLTTRRIIADDISVLEALGTWK